jgi:hypothetical protein
MLKDSPDIYCAMLDNDIPIVSMQGVNRAFEPPSSEYSSQAPKHLPLCFRTEYGFKHVNPMIMHASVPAFFMPLAGGSGRAAYQGLLLHYLAARILEVGENVLLKSLPSDQSMRRRRFLESLTGGAGELGGRIGSSVEIGVSVFPATADFENALLSTTSPYQDPFQAAKQLERIILFERMKNFFRHPIDALRLEIKLRSSGVDRNK